MEREQISPWPDDFGFAGDDTFRALRRGFGRVDLHEAVEWEGATCLTIQKTNAEFWAERQRAIDRHRRRIQRHLASRPGIAASGGRDRTDES